MTAREHEDPVDRGEFVRLWSAHRAHLFNFIYSLLPDAAGAEEVFQRVSIVLWKKFDDLRSQDGFWRWSARVAQLEVQNYRRQTRCERLQFWDAEVIDLIAATHLQQSDVLESQRSALRSCLEKLERRDRQLVERRYGADKVTTRELASQLGRPLVTLYKSLSRIRRSLFKCVQRTLAADSGR